MKENGPWTIVQKQRWPRKGRDKGGPVELAATRVPVRNANGDVGNTCSRFGILLNDAIIMEENNDGNDHVVAVKEIAMSALKFQYAAVKSRKKVTVKSGGTQVIDLETESQPLANKPTPRVEHVPQNNQDILRNIPVGPSRGEHVDQVTTSGVILLGMQRTNAEPIVSMDQHMDTIASWPQHPPRPLDLQGMGASDHPFFNNGFEFEEYMDAQEQGAVRSDEFDVVMETPGV